MNSIYRNRSELLLFTGSLIASFGSRILVRQIWKSLKGYYPPENPVKDQVSGVEAISWTLALALIGGAAKYLFRKKASDKLLSKRAL